MLWLKRLDIVVRDAVAESAHNPTVKTQLDKNFTQAPIPKQAMEMLRNEGFNNVPPDLEVGVRTIFGLPGTLPCELANKATRKMQDRAQEHGRVSGERIFAAPYKDEVMSKLGFDENSHLEHTSAHSRSAHMKQMSHSLFNPGAVPSELPLRTVSSSKDVAPFHTTSAMNEPMQYGCVALWRHCVITKDWGLINRSWLVCLIHPGQLVFRKVDSTWHLVVRLLENTSALTLRFEEVMLEGLRVVRRVRNKDLRFDRICVLNVNQYETWHFTLLGHGWRLLQPLLGKSKPIWPKEFTGPVYRLDGAAMSLEKGCAWAGCPNVAFSTLKVLLEDKGKKLPVHAGDYKAVEMFITTHLKDELRDEAHLLDLLDLRFSEEGESHSHALIDVLESKEAADAFGEQEVAMLESWKKCRAERARKSKTYKERLSERRLNYSKTVSKSTKAAMSKSIRGKVTLGTRVYPTFIDQGTMTDVDALVFFCHLTRKPRFQFWKTGGG